MEKQKVKKLKSFHGKKAIKDKYVSRVKEHYKADEIMQGSYWQNGKGCAVGCTLERTNSDGGLHKRYEEELGLPEWLALLEDSIFERLSNGEAKEFPLKLLQSIKVGSDLSLIRPKFLLYCLENLPKDYEKYPDRKKAIEEVIAILKLDSKGKIVKQERRDAAESAAWSAAWSAAESAAESAARSAAWSAAESAAWSAAESAAWSAAWSAAESAAWSAAESAAWSAAESAAWSAAWSAAESAAESAARSAAYSKMAKYLLKILGEAK